MTNDFIIDDWWLMIYILMTDDWWLMILLLMTYDWWLMTDDDWQCQQP